MVCRPYHLLMSTRGGSEEDIADEALLSGISVGDEGAVIAFVRRYQRRLYGLALGILGDSAMAEDVTQEAFIRILRHAAVFDARRGSVTSWVLTITRNLAIDASRMRRGVPTAPQDRVFMNLMSNVRLPEDAADSDDNVIRVRAALAGLPPEQRRAIVLATLYGRTVAEVAREEDIPLGTAKSRIRLGMAKLRDTIVLTGPS
jgi:RNA polymerase sigma factor (sigma-70 family)